MNETEHLEALLLQRRKEHKLELRRKRIRTAALILVLTLLLVAGGFLVRRLWINPYREPTEINVSAEQTES